MIIPWSSSKRGLGSDATMVQPEHDIALQDTDRLQGRAALVNNVKAAVALAGAVRSTLGPRGLDKMLVDSDGSSLVTNDGVTVLETAQIEHPTARLLIAASASQDKVARDGTTTTVVLTAELLQNALEMVRSGIHPSIVINGYSIAQKECLDELESMSKEASSPEEGRSVVSTSLAGKIGESLAEHLTGLAIEAAEVLSDEEGGDDLERLRVKRLPVSGGLSTDSELVNGLVIAKTRLDKITPASSEGGRVAVIDGGLENPKLEIDAEIEVRSAGVLQGFHKRTMENLQNQVDHLSSLGVDLLVVRDGIADEAASLLREAGITAYRRLERNDLEMASRITGSQIVRDVKGLEGDDIGSYTRRSEIVTGGVTHTRIDGEEGGAMTVMIRGSSPQIREECERAFDDALGVAFRLTRDSRMLPGGGATQTHLARHLRIFAPTNKGREQIAIEGYAAALEVVPRTLAENAGLSPIDEVLELSASQASDPKNGSWIGLNAWTGERTRMDKLGVLDPLFVVSNSISGSTEAAISVLRINDVLWAKQDPTTPDWKDEDDQED
ncbi:MAG: thermosome subunit [Methanobacteriota archaeon]|nr:MAG: thermosome subunit [Euryarchaeota archaeon]